MKMNWKDIFKEIKTLLYNKKNIVLKSWNDKTNNLQLLDDIDIDFSDSEIDHEIDYED